MRFEPKSEEAIRESLQPLPAGKYDFEVLEASDEKSKKGNDMIKVNLGIYQGDAIRWRVYDYLLSAMEAKLRHFCDTTGLLAKYEDGTLSAADCKGRAGQVELVIEKTDAYGTQNKVKDYVSRPAKPLSGPEPAKAPEPEDDVPF